MNKSPNFIEYFGLPYPTEYVFPRFYLKRKEDPAFETQDFLRFQDCVRLLKRDDG
jgi:hypothetical protein